MFDRPKSQCPGLERLVREAKAAAAGNGPIHLVKQMSREDQGKYLNAMIDRGKEEQKARELAAQAAAALIPRVE